MELKTLGEVDRYVEAKMFFMDPEYGPQHIHIDHVSAELRNELMRGDFVEFRTRAMVRLWLRRERRRKLARDRMTPNGLALRNTLAAERANRHSLAAVIISLLALAISIWPLIFTSKVPEVIPPSKITQVQPRT